MHRGYCGTGSQLGQSVRPKCGGWWGECVGVTSGCVQVGVCVDVGVTFGYVWMWYSK